MPRRRLLEVVIADLVIGLALELGLRFDLGFGFGFGFGSGLAIGFRYRPLGRLVVDRSVTRLQRVVLAGESEVGERERHLRGRRTHFALRIGPGRLVRL